MDLRNATAITIGSKPVSRIYIDNKKAWEAGVDLTSLRMDFENITKLTDNTGYIYYGPKKAKYDPSKMNLSHVRTVYGGSAYWDIDVTLYENNIEKVDLPEYEGRIPFKVDIQYNGSGKTGMYPDARWNFTATYEDISVTNDVGCVPTWHPQHVWLYMPEEEISSTGDHTIYINYDPVGSVVDHKSWIGLTGACYISELYIQYSDPTHSSGGSCSTIEATLPVDQIYRDGKQTIQCILDGVWSEPYELNVKMPVPISTLHIDFDSITKLTDNQGYIYYGPKGATEDPSEMNLTYIKSKGTQSGAFSDFEKIDLNFDSSTAEKVSDPEYEGRIPFTIDTPIHNNTSLEWKGYRGVYPDVEWTLTATYNNHTDSKVIGSNPTWKPEYISLNMGQPITEPGQIKVYMFAAPVGSVISTPILMSFTTNNWRPRYGSVHPPYVTYAQEMPLYMNVMSATIDVISVNSTGTDTFYWSTDGLITEYVANVVKPEPVPLTTLHIDFDKVTKLNDNQGYIYYGPKGAKYDPDGLTFRAWPTGSGGGSNPRLNVLDRSFDSSNYEKVDHPDYEGRVPFTVGAMPEDPWPDGKPTYGIYGDSTWDFIADYTDPETGETINDTKLVTCEPTWKPDWCELVPDQVNVTEPGKFKIYMHYSPAGSVINTQTLDGFTTSYWTPVQGGVFPPAVNYTLSRGYRMETIIAELDCRNIKSYPGEDTFWWSPNGFDTELHANCVIYFGSGPSEGVSVDLNDEWTESTYNKPSDCPEGYNMYMSDSNYHVDGGIATMYIIFGEDYSGEFTIYINSYAEPNCDYTKAYALDSTRDILVDTLDYQSDPSSNMDAWKAVTYNIPNDGNTHQIRIGYFKDGSVDNNYDRGFVLIPVE